MGAEENDQSQTDSVRYSVDDVTEAMLDHGWRIVSLPDGQLRLVGPPAYGDEAA